LTHHDIPSEPAGEVYLSLLEFAEQQDARFSLVWRQQAPLGAGAYALKRVLRPFMERQVRTAEWPGTRLIGHTAMVRIYRLVPEAARVLAEAGRLFAWRAPERPEDLAFYSADGRCWLASIAHERQAYVTLDDAGLAALRAAVPGLLSAVKSTR